MPISDEELEALLDKFYKDIDDEELTPAGYQPPVQVTIDDTGLTVDVGDTEVHIQKPEGEIEVIADGVDVDVDVKLEGGKVTVSETPVNNHQTQSEVLD